MMYDVHGAEAAQDWVIQPHTATVLLNSLRGWKLLPATFFLTVYNINIRRKKPLLKIDNGYISCTE